MYHQINNLKSKMRITLSRISFAVFLVLCVILIWTIINEGDDNKNIVKICKRSDEFQTNLHDLAFRTHSLLVKLGLTHFLCYGALWGQIRNSKIQSWATVVEICALNEELSQIEEAQLYRSFHKNGLIIKYLSSEGTYNIVDPTFEEGKVELYVFELDIMIQMYRRVGWKRRVLPPDCQGMKSLECFPPRLILPPIPKKEFGGYIFPVPREGIEIQKYHYEQNWWKNIKPQNC